MRPPNQRAEGRRGTGDLIHPMMSPVMAGESQTKPVTCFSNALCTSQMVTQWILGVGFTVTKLVKRNAPIQTRPYPSTILEELQLC